MCVCRTGLFLIFDCTAERFHLLFCYAFARSKFINKIYNLISSCVPTHDEYICKCEIAQQTGAHVLLSFSVDCIHTSFICVAHHKLSVPFFTLTICCRSIVSPTLDRSNYSLTHGRECIGIHTSRFRS